MITTTAIILVAATGVAPQEEVKVVKHSVAPPFFSGNGFSIPNWEFGGNSVVTDEAVRLTPDRQNKRGNLWNKVPCEMENWQLTVEFKVSGQGQSLFGDGFGIWFTEQHGETGTALGNTESFKGLGIFVDTYDNHQEDHGHPWVSGFLNDGTHVYNHDEDGAGVMTEGCQAFFRNVDYPTYLRVTFRRKHMTLEVETNVGGNGEWTECFTQHDVWLPEHAYFGATASTGDLADNHDIISMSVEAPPAPTAAFMTAWKKHKAAAPVGSMDMAKRMQAAAKKKKQNPFDLKKMVSNHKKNKQIKQELADAESGSGLLIGLFALLVVGGVVAYFLLKPKDEKQLRKYNSGGF